MNQRQTEQKELDALRARLSQALQRAPAWINGASVQAVRKWKADYAKARKVADKKSATAAELTAAINSVQ